MQPDVYMLASGRHRSHQEQEHFYEQQFRVLVTKSRSNIKKSGKPRARGKKSRRCIGSPYQIPPYTSQLKRASLKPFEQKIMWPKANGRTMRPQSAGAASSAAKLQYVTNMVQQLGSGANPTPKQLCAWRKAQNTPHHVDKQKKRRPHTANATLHLSYHRKNTATTRAVVHKRPATAIGVRTRSSAPSTKGKGTANNRNSEIAAARRLRPGSAPARARAPSPAAAALEMYPVSNGRKLTYQDNNELSVLSRLKSDGDHAVLRSIVLRQSLLSSITAKLIRSMKTRGHELYDPPTAVIRTSRHSLRLFFPRCISIHT